MRSATRFLRQVSLRSKLTALMALLMTIGVIATTFTASFSLRLTMVDQMDQDLASYSSPMANILYAVYQEESSQDTSPSSPYRMWANLELTRFHATLRNADGQVLAELPGIEGDDEPVIDPVGVEHVKEVHDLAFTAPGATPESEGWRYRMIDMANGAGYITIALPLSDVEHTVSDAAGSMVTSGMLATLLMSLVAYAATGRAFRPLVRVERTAAAIAAGDLSRRVEETSHDTEVGRLSRALNAMLAHIEHAFRAQEASERKMRRFVQDASHELRTPLVTIRGYSELYRHGGIREPEQLDSAMGRIEGEAKRMGQLVEDLLTLARLDEQRALERVPVDLLLLGSDAVEDARVNAPDRTVRLVGLDGGPALPAPTSGDESRLRQVVANLLTNALRYTPEGTPIEIAVGTMPVIDGRSDSVLEIRDHGPGISEEDAARVFERFYRADTSRHRETGGTGLGLAIVAAIVAQHDGSVRLSETPGGGATLSIHLPYEPMPDHTGDEDVDHEEDAAGPPAGPGRGTVGDGTPPPQGS
ncbi:HAMP domain-containing sensor histidine kinase [Zhihengliuella alba]|uniref:histidine kinase n=1 Tax=Zhihengliuella alba TaxID=547018 RepID=A0ABP7D5U5_9MICC